MKTKADRSELGNSLARKISPRYIWHVVNTALKEPTGPVLGTVAEHHGPQPLFGHGSF